MPKPIEIYSLVRLQTPLEASEVVAALQAFLAKPIGGAFVREAARAVVLRPEPLYGDPVLYLSGAALYAAQLAGIVLPPVTEEVPRADLPAERLLVVGEAE